MKIVITGSLGHIGKPLAQTLVHKGHAVTVISSNRGKEKEIEALGAVAAIGSVEDTSFLTTAFTGADAVYCMIPPNFSEPNQITYYTRIGENYVQAIRVTGVKRVVELSSYGAHLPEGTGFIVGSHRVEQLFNALEETNVTHLRPGYFYYNLFNFIGMIQHAGIMAANYGAEDWLALTAPSDIAEAAAEELLSTFNGKKVRYVVSDDRTCNDIAAAIGKAIGKTDLKWLVLSDEEMKKGLLQHGVPSHIADNLVELGAATHTGRLREEFNHQKPTAGKVKLEEFLKEFVSVYSKG